MQSRFDENDGSTSEYIKMEKNPIWQEVESCLESEITGKLICIKKQRSFSHTILSGTVMAKSILSRASAIFLPTS